jgi:transposase InsO family protein
MDFLKLEKSKGGYEDVLVITDHFTRYTKAIPCRNQKATTTARALYEHFIIHYFFPEQLYSDQGRNFESKVIKELCWIANVRKTRTTPFHPMGNPSAERFNKTLIRMLRTLADDHKTSWADYVLPRRQAYNATKNSPTGFSTHFLMVGWHPRLSVDAYLGTAFGNESGVSHASYVSRI